MIFLFTKIKFKIKFLNIDNSLLLLFVFKLKVVKFYLSQNRLHITNYECKVEKFETLETVICI